MNNRISVATIDSPEFINLKSMDINPLMSKCDVKVLYVGQNRNRSCITKEVATEMSKTLRGCPIVGYYIENKEDFGDHGDQVIIDGEGVKFNKLTKPYGFVAPDAKVWFQFFEDQDEFGNTCVREYLMTEGYLWTGQFEECQRVLENSNPQSMELDEATLKGYWSTDYNRGVDFFIINDAVFSKLCILGDDVEPCFEGASVSAPNLSSKFSKNDDFTNSLFSMMNELKFALKNSEGGQQMSEFQNEMGNDVETTSFENQNTVETPATQFEEATGEENNDTQVAPATVEDDDVSSNRKTDFSEKGSASASTCKEDEEEDKEEKKNKFKKEEDKEEKSDSQKTEDNTEEEKNEDEKSESKEDEEEKKNKFSLLEQELATLKVQYAALQEENTQLQAFKKQIQNKEKDELIASFYMLSDEDKKDVIANKEQYSLKEIKAELSMICVDKKVNFNLDKDTSSSAESAPVIYNLNAHQADSMPAWLKAVEDTRNRNK